MDVRSFSPSREFRVSWTQLNNKKSSQDILKIFCVYEYICKCICVFVVTVTIKFTLLNIYYFFYYFTKLNTLNFPCYKIISLKHFFLLISCHWHPTGIRKLIILLSIKLKTLHLNEFNLYKSYF